METEVYFKGVWLDIDYDHTPGEPEERYDSNGTGHPGCPEELIINKIKIKGEDVTELLDDQIDDIIDQMIRSKSNGKPIDLERIKALYRDFHHGDKD
jgi:hypothetical protein